MPEVMGGGAALFDYDGDGDLDLYLIAGGERVPIDGAPLQSFNRLFRHETDGSFSDVTATAGVGDHGYGMGCAVGDIDNDHDLDLYVTNWGPGRAVPQRRRRPLHRHHPTVGRARSGLVGVRRVLRLRSRRPARSVRDALRRLRPRSRVRRRERPARVLRPDRVLRECTTCSTATLGGGRFEDVSRRAGITTVEDAGLGVVTADFDDDGWLDVYVANDADPNNLWINQRDGTFVDEAVVLGAAYNLHGLAEAGMGVVAGDADDDGDLDLFVTHLIRETNTLYRNQGAGRLRGRHRGRRPRLREPRLHRLRHRVLRLRQRRRSRPRGGERRRQATTAAACCRFPEPVLERLRRARSAVGESRRSVSSTPARRRTLLHDARGLAGARSPPTSRRTAASICW